MDQTLVITAEPRDEQRIEKRPVESSYRQIFASTTLIGCSQVITIVLGIVRSKVLAVLLGSSGVGLIGLYSSITGLVSMFADMGIASSGVRQIAEANGTGNHEQLARTAITLRRVAFVLGTLGALVMAAAAVPLSRITFGDASHAWALAFLSFTIFFGALSAGQAALIQGMRRMSSLAAMNVLGGLLGTAFSIPFVFFWHDRGIVPFLIATAAGTVAMSWWYARQIQLSPIVVTWRDMVGEARGLLNLGFLFMASWVMTSATLYAVRLIVVRNLGLDAAGLFHAATTLSTVYIGMILTAMGSDFYPRLTAVANDNRAVNRLVNEQMEVGLLVALPGVVFTLAFAPLILQILYSAAFVSAYEVLRWYILGVLLRVICWPLGYIVMAKGKGVLFFWTETAVNVLQLVFAVFGVLVFGLAGTGIGFFLALLLYTIMMIGVARWLSGFAYSAPNRRRMLVAISIVLVLFVAGQILTESRAMIVGAVLTLIAATYSLRSLRNILGPIDVSRVFRMVGIRR